MLVIAFKLATWTWAFTVEVPFACRTKVHKLPPYVIIAIYPCGKPGWTATQLDRSSAVA